MAATAEHLRAEMEALLPSEWGWLVRLCATLSGNADAAEDLAQEAMIEAWQHADRIRNPDAHRAWLAGIARNVCRRWARRQARDAARRERLMTLAPMEDAPDHAGDLALERDELAALLDRALGHLPASTRAVLVHRYIDERPHAEIAGRLGLSEGAVMVRAHRGRLALKQALASPELRAEAAAFGLVDPAAAEWRVTRIWCPFCGRHRLKTCLDPEAGMLVCMCTGPCTDNGAIIGGTRLQPASRTLSSTKAILARELVSLHRFYRQSLVDNGSTCFACGRHIALEPWHPELPLPEHTGHPHGIRMHCDACGSESSASLWHLLLDTPEAQRFWRRHPRIEALPVREVERDGLRALVSGFSSVNDTARLEIVSACESWDILHVEGLTSR